ncbi:MAG: PQQ-dependent sugar dehydrogenase [Acidobacteriota bacterium]|nr:PQQ-dependent sugar dehydrogenase [Acidobacteriota bacterium]
MKATSQFAVALFLILTCGSFRTSAHDAQPAALALEPVLSNLSSPVLLTNARDGSNRLFVVEQPGRIQALQPNAAAPTVFLDITARVLAGGERGLLGLAFHPQFRTNRRFFVNYTRQPDGATVIAEYRVSATDPNVAETGETVLLVIPQPFANHNGGMIEFGPDGFLYIGMGDGGSGNDPGNRAQNVAELLGKMLRINVDQPDGSTPYSSPPDNPFFGSVPGRDEIYALGLRNPFRFSFDRATGQLYAGDVGQNSREEIDIITRGGNYGWRVFEGTRCTGLGPAQCNPADFQAPIAEYEHTGGRCSVTGGYVYRGTRASLPTGAYVFGDFCTGEIFLLQGGTQSLLQDTSLNISSFGEDEAGELYVVSLGGTVHRLTNSCSFSITPTAQSFAATGGNGSVTVNTTSDCNWTATSSVSWSRITAGSAGTGNGAVTFSVEANTGPARTGTLIIAGQTFTVTQAAAPATVQFSAPAYSFDEGAGQASVTITRAGDTSAAVTVDFATVDDPAEVRCDTVNGTAYARCDYTTTIDTVRFAAGDGEPKTIAIPLIDDAHAEGSETVQLRLSSSSGATLGAQATATLTITDNDAAGQANPILSTPLFVRMHYLDFLSREPEAGEPWSAILNNCPNPFNTDAQSQSASCDRLQVSFSFFGSPEFRLKGFYVFIHYRVAFDRLAEYAEIVADMRAVTGTTPADTAARRAAFPVSFIARAEFRNRYDALSHEAFVNALLGRYNLGSITTPDPANPEGGAKVTLTRADLINRLNGTGGALTRAQVLRAIVESDEVTAVEFNRAFVATQYYGYLRRTPEASGYQAWLDYLNANPMDSRTMVNGFLNAVEYKLRFGQP